MMILKATKAALKDLNVKPLNLDLSDPFLSWHVNFFNLYGNKHYVFMNDLSRLSLTVTGIRKNQPEKMKEALISDLRDYLDIEQVSKMLIHSYLRNCDEIEITKTDNRSVLSTENEIMKVMKSLERRKIDEFKDPIRRHTWNNRIIYSPIDYQKPLEVFIKELERRYKK